MHLFWWQQLPLLLMVQLLQLSSTVQIRHDETLFVGESILCNNNQSSGWIERHPKNHGCYQLKTQVHLLSQPPISPQSVSRTSHVGLRERIYIFHNGRTSKMKIDGSNSVPTLTPLQSVDEERPRKKKVASIVGGAGATLLVIIIIIIVYMGLMQIKKLAARTSERASSALSPQLEIGETDMYASSPLHFGTQILRAITIEELKHATRSFSENNIIGEGTFGLVYKGLLLDGSIAAIKRNMCRPIQNFVNEAKLIASIQHQHLVKLIGYCEEKQEQFLVFEFISYGNVGQYLYDSEGLLVGKLGIKRRLSIALGAARGLRYLHGLVPPFLHMHFRTSNVLVDEKFTAKVADYGLHKLRSQNQHLGSGSSSFTDHFLDPELNSLKNFSESSDVYSFGVFLLELISGRDVNCKYQSDSDHTLLLQARSNNLGSFVDKSLMAKEHTKRAMVDLALMCVDSSTRRPLMASVVRAIEVIREWEIGDMHPDLGEEIGAFKLGSELFK